MAGRGYENGKYFEINSRGKLKESADLPKKKHVTVTMNHDDPRDVVDHMRRVQHTEEQIEKRHDALRKNSMKEHEHPYWDKK